MKYLFILLISGVSCLGSETVPVPVDKIVTTVNDHKFNKVKFSVTLKNKTIKETTHRLISPESIQILLNKNIYQLSFKGLSVEGVSLERQITHMSIEYNLNGSECSGYWINLYLRDSIPQLQSTKSISVFFDFRKKIYSKVTHPNDLVMFPINEKFSSVITVK